MINSLSKHVLKCVNEILPFRGSCTSCLFRRTTPLWQPHLTKCSFLRSRMRQGVTCAIFFLRALFSLTIRLHSSNGLLLHLQITIGILRHQNIDTRFSSTPKTFETLGVDLASMSRTFSRVGST